MQRIISTIDVCSRSVIGFFEPSSLLNPGITIVTLVVLYLVSKTQLAKSFVENLSRSAEQTKGLLNEREQEIARLSFELKSTTRELRQAREFTVEDRAKMRVLENRCILYAREINRHRSNLGLPPLLAGSEDDDEHVSHLSY